MITNSKVFVSTTSGIRELTSQLPYAWNKYEIKQIVNGYEWDKHEKGIVTKTRFTSSTRQSYDTQQDESSRQMTVWYTDVPFDSHSFTQDTFDTEFDIPTAKSSRSNKESEIVDLTGKAIIGINSPHNTVILEADPGVGISISFGSSSRNAYAIVNSGYKYVVRKGRGDFIETITDPASDTYPRDGIGSDGMYWYYYKGPHYETEKIYQGVVYSDSPDAYPIDGEHSDGFWYTRI